MNTIQDFLINFQEIHVPNIFISHIYILENNPISRFLYEKWTPFFAKKTKVEYYFSWKEILAYILFHLGAVISHL